MNNSFLLNDFYTLTNLFEQENQIKSEIVLNPQHPIFKGHFEQMPVVPGVCQTQIVKEILQQKISQNLTLTVGDNIKFMAMITPTQHTNIYIEIVYKQVENDVVVDAKLFHENITFTKFKGKFTLN